MEIYDYDQYSPEWWDVRKGIPTASQFHKIVTTTGAPSKQAKKYMYQLAAEYVSGEIEETFQSAAMRRGSALEENARRMYAMINGTEVKQTGFCINNNVGCSCDGLIGDDGIVEIKCKTGANFVELLEIKNEALISQKLTSDHVQQIQGQLMVTERKWCDLFCYYPNLQPITIRFKRDEEFIKKLDAELRLFNDELQKLIKRINY